MFCTRFHDELDFPCAGQWRTSLMLRGQSYNYAVKPESAIVSSLMNENPTHEHTRSYGHICEPINSIASTNSDVQAWYGIQFDYTNHTLETLPFGNPLS